MPKGRPFSNDLRQVVLHMSEEEISAKEISCSTGISLRTVQRFLEQARKGITVRNEDRAPQPSRKLHDDAIRYLISCIQQRPNIYLDELRDKLFMGMHVSVSVSTVYKALRKAGLTMKKVTKAARERDVEKRAEYFAKIAKYQPHERVYVDESRFDQRDAERTRAWAFKGERALQKVFFLRGKSYSVLPALSLSGVLHVKIVENAFNMETFNEFIAELLTKMNPYDPEEHPPNSVIILDNCRIHKDREMLEMVLERGMRIEFLPPYSPDLNPIELCFAGMKRWIQRNMDEAKDAWEDNNHPNRVRWLLYDMAYFPTPRMALGWYMRAGIL